MIINTVVCLTLNTDAQRELEVDFKLPVKFRQFNGDVSYIDVLSVGGSV